LRAQGPKIQEEPQRGSLPTVNDFFKISRTLQRFYKRVRYLFFAQINNAFVRFLKFEMWKFSLGSVFKYKDEIKKVPSHL
jgi:hypothetical protein